MIATRSDKPPSNRKARRVFAAAQKTDEWPLTAIYAGLLAIALGWILIWVLHTEKQIAGSWVETWAPHGASVALELFVASVVVGGLLRRHERRAREPLAEAALLRLRLTLSSVLRTIAVQYGLIAPDGSPLPERWPDVIAKWLELLGGGQQGWLPQWFRELDRVSVDLESLRERYDHELDPATLAGIDAFLHHWREDEGFRLRSSYETAKSVARLFEVPEPDARQLTHQQMTYVRAVMDHAEAMCHRYELITKQQLELDSHANEQFRLAQITRRAAVHP